MSKSQAVVLTLFIINELMNIILIIIDICNNEGTYVTLYLMAMLAGIGCLSYVFKENE